MDLLKREPWTVEERHADPPRAPRAGIALRRAPPPRRRLPGPATGRHAVRRAGAAGLARRLAGGRDRPHRPALGRGVRAPLRLLPRRLSYLPRLPGPARTDAAPGRPP